MPELTTLLFSQQTVLVEHAFPELMAAAEIGEHLRPIWAVVSCRTTPRVLSRADPAAELAYTGYAGQRGRREERENRTYALHAVAALHGTRVAVLSRREGDEGDGRDSRETREHGDQS